LAIYNCQLFDISNGHRLNNYPGAPVPLTGPGPLEGLLNCQLTIGDLQLSII